MDEHVAASIKVAIRDENFVLHRSNVVYWEEEKALLFSDVHLGKAEVFQASGIAVPTGADDENIRKLRSLATEFGAEKFYCLGDFIHSKQFWTNSIPRTVETFLNEVGPRFMLIAGNHEAGTAKNFRRFGCSVVEDEVQIRHFLLSHENAASDQNDIFMISGHVHPVVKIGSYADSVTARCFHLTKKTLLLPAFGEFTGGYKVKPKANDRVFVTMPDSIIEL